MIQTIRNLGAGLNYVQLTDDFLGCVTAEGAINAQLPQINQLTSNLQYARGIGTDLFTYKFVDVSGKAATNPVTITAGDGDTINGLPSITINVNGFSGILFLSGNNNWVFVASNVQNGGGGGGGGVNDLLSKLDAGVFDITVTNQVFGSNYLVLDAGTYFFDFCYDYIPDPAGAELVTAQIRTNVNPLITGVNGSDVVVAETKTKVLNPYDPDVQLAQFLPSAKYTFASQFIVKSALQTAANAAFGRNLLLRAFKLIV